MHFAGWNFTTKHLAIKLPGSSLQCVSAFVQELSKQRPYTHAVLYILTTTQADPPIKVSGFVVCFREQNVIVAFIALE